MYIDELLDHISKESVDRRKGRAQQAKSNAYHVSDVIRCKKMVELLNANPERSAEIAIKPMVLMGTLCHEGLGKYFVYKEISRGKIIGDYTIIGTYDFNTLRCDGIGKGIMELKTSIFRKPDTEPADHHILTCKLYSWIFGMKVALTYFTLRGWFQKYYTNDMTDDEILALLEDKKSPVWDWECQYCIFKGNDCSRTSFPKVTLKGDDFPQITLKGDDETDVDR